MRIHRVYCKSVSGPNTKFALDNIQSHHLIKALRLKEGRVVEVFDGNGSSASCEIVLLNNNKCELERISDVNKYYETHRTLTNIIPFIKTNNFHYMIQKLSEIGVNKFITKNQKHHLIRLSLDLLLCPIHVMIRVQKIKNNFLMSVN